jgi:hypothetical protein
VIDGFNFCGMEKAEKALLEDKINFRRIVFLNFPPKRFGRNK